MFFPSHLIISNNYLKQCLKDTFEPLKLIKNLYLSKSWLILYSTHPLKKTNFSEGANLVTYSVLLTAEKLVLTFAMNRLACCEQLCAILRNSLHYRQCYEETRV